MVLKHLQYGRAARKGRSHGGDRKGDALPRRNKFGSKVGESEAAFHFFKFKLNQIKFFRLSHFCVGLCCFLFCKGVGFESSTNLGFWSA